MKIYTIARKSKDEDFTEENAIPSELSKGIKVEKEHKDPNSTKKQIEDEAKKVALDHLAEIPDYYTRLLKMEDEAKLGQK